MSRFFSRLGHLEIALDVCLAIPFSVDTLRSTHLAAVSKVLRHLAVQPSAAETAAQRTVSGRADAPIFLKFPVYRSSVLGMPTVASTWITVASVSPPLFWPCLPYQNRWGSSRHEWVGVIHRPTHSNPYDCVGGQTPLPALTPSADAHGPSPR